MRYLAVFLLLAAGCKKPMQLTPQPTRDEIIRHWDTNGPIPMITGIWCTTYELSNRSIGREISSERYRVHTARLKALPIDMPPDRWFLINVINSVDVYQLTIIQCESGIKCPAADRLFGRK